ncbi:MAG TPA: ATP-binding protein [Thermoplasmata archaeon]|nr:ATP-binding protein [Thermoplasmata archaeon]
MAQTTPSEIAGANSAAPVAVLVVDGNEDHQILSVAALTRKGWIVRTAASRKQGLQLALSYHFDAVVIASKLRDGNGIELLRALGGRLPGTPIIFVVPLGGEEAALQAMESGAQSYIVKTPRYNELLPAIVEEHVVEARNRKRLVETEEIQAQAVTARKTVEEQLSQSQTRLKLVLEQAPVLLWSTDRDLRVTSAMGTGFRDLKLPHSEERGLSVYEYFNIHDDDIEPIVSHRRALLGESVATQIEWQGRTYDVHMEPFRSKDGAIIGTIGVAFDVSERTRTEESLRRSEERFQLLGHATNDVVWDWDLQTDGMWMNENVAAMFGYRAEDVEPTGTWWEERLHPDDRARVGSSLDDVIGSGGSVWSAEYRFRRHDGTYATIVDRGYVLHDASGHPVRMIGSVMDVSKQRKAEAIQSAVYRISEAANAAKDLPELYRHIHKVIGGLMPATNFYIALYNDRAQTLTFPYFVDEEEGPPPPQKLGRGLTEYVLRTGRPLLASPAVFAELNRSGEVEQVGPPSVDWVGAPLVGLGKIIGVIVVQSYREGVRFAEEDKAILNFVSEQVAGAIERRRTQENLVQTSSELQAIFRAVPDLYFRLAADGKILGYYAGRYADLYVPPESFLGRRIQEVLPREVGEPFGRAMQKVLRTNSVATMEYSLEVQAGRKELEARIIPLLGDQLVVVVRDITETKAAEAALKESTDRLRQSERLATLGQLAGFIAHELNTPLTSISLLTDAAGRRTKDAGVHEKLEKIDAERRRAADIIRSLTSLSRSRQINAVDSDLRSIVEAALDEVRRYRKKGVSIEVNLGDVPLRLKADPLQLQEVIVNLVKNAIDATDHGSVRVRLEGRPRFYAVVVSDTGSGMSADVLSRVFDPTFTTKPRGEGLGLGLPLAKHIVAGHGGTIEATSRPGAGSTFTVLLPRRDVDEDPDRR